MNIEQYIGVGFKNGKTREELRQETGLPDRVLRMALHNGDLPIVSFGGVYFIPAEGDEVYTRSYMRAERAKALRILANVSRIAKQTGIHTDDIEGQVLLPIVEGVD